MKQYVSFSFVLAAVCVCTRAFAQSPDVSANERKGFATIGQDALHHDVAYLASDRLAGRLSGQPGDDQAVQWIAGQFAKANLEPIALKASGLPGYEQSFAITEYVPDREHSALTLVRGEQSTVWHAPQAVGAYKHNLNITAPVVFAGYGISDAELKYDDYAGLDAKGKIVLIFDHEPQEDNPQSVFYGTGNTKYATARVKVLNAQAHGAVAVIVMAEPNRKHPTNAERYARIGGTTERTTPIPLQAIEQDEVTIPAITVVDQVASVLLATSGTTASELQTKIDVDLSPQGLALPDTTVTIHLHNISEDDKRLSNVVGLLRGSDPKLRAETIIISAHHDHDGTSPCPSGKAGVDEAGAPVAAGADCVETWHGADDNASGTAGVVALARAFAANGAGSGAARPRRSVLFVVFAGEERGLLGSYWMAAHPLRPLATTRAMINFDMIGRDETASPQTDGLIEVPADTSNRLNLVGAEYSPEYDRVVKEEDKDIGLTIDDRFDHEHILNVLFRSDQFPFLLRNVPAMWWFTGFHPDYHHVTDTAEKLDYAKMAKILELAYLTAWRFGNDETGPEFVADPPAPAAQAAPATVGAGGSSDSGVRMPVAPVQLAPAMANGPTAAVRTKVTPVKLGGMQDAAGGPK